MKKEFTKCQVEQDVMEAHRLVQVKRTLYSKNCKVFRRLEWGVGGKSKNEGKR